MKLQPPHAAAGNSPVSRAVSETAQPTGLEPPKTAPHSRGAAASSNCLGKGIAVYAIAGKGGMAPTGAHNNIVIENNTITDVEDLHIWVSSTKGLTLKDNTYDTTKLKLENCQDVKR